MTAAGRWLDARERCDLDELARLTAPDAYWESPVVGEVHGRDEVVGQIEAGFGDADAFSTSLLSLDERGARAVAVVRNTGRRGDETLDSVQALFLTVRDGLVAAVRVVVDDPEAIEEFWSE